jgi:hypothetical protein
MSTLKRIDFEKGTFSANGKEYCIEGGLSIERYAEMQILEKELAYGFTVKGIFDKLRSLWDLLNKLKFAECVIIVNDLMRGAARVQERENAVLKICALFINYEDEDRTAFSQDLMNAKIKDWQTEGIDVRDFFAVALNSVSGFLEVYQIVTRTILDQTEKPAAVSQKQD